MKKTLNVLLVTLVMGAGCSSAVTSYSRTNTSESTNHSSGVEGIIAAEAETQKEECYYMKENEHVLPDVVVETFLSLVFGDTRAHLYLAYYFNGHELHQDAKTEMAEIEKTFYKKMSGLGYSPEETLLYLVILNQPSGIVIKESAFREPVTSSNSFKKTLEHERIHYEFDKRPMQEKEILLSLHQELMRRDDIWRKFSQAIGLVFYDNNFGDGEFAAHLVSRAWYLVEDVKKEFPREYDILSEIKGEAEAKICDCDSVVK